MISVKRNCGLSIRDSLCSGEGDVHVNTVKQILTVYCADGIPQDILSITDLRVFNQRFKTSIEMQ